MMNLYWANNWNGVNHEASPTPTEEQAKEYAEAYRLWQEPRISFQVIQSNG